ncbi:TPA: AbrB/MazE/SpoVT family DNA-binding domain-containing protein [Clostridioides difficile]|nr:AbrB/MazE/SpoVT family DNA-binding domain-containing protein [Clostridioides difficile]
MEQVKRNISINKSGGTSGKGSVGYKLSIPSGMMKELGITKDNRSVILTCENGKIIIEKNIECKE